MSSRLIELAQQLSAQVNVLNKNKEVAEKILKQSMDTIKDIDKVKAQEIEAQAMHLINTATNGGDFSSLYAKYSQSNKEVKND